MQGYARFGVQISDTTERKKNTSSNLKRGLYLEKKFSQYITCLDIETEIVYRVSCAIILCFKMFLF